MYLFFVGTGNDRFFSPYVHKMIRRSLPCQVKVGAGMSTLRIVSKIRSSDGSLRVRMQQRIDGQTHLFVPRIVTRGLQDEFDDVTVVRGEWIIPGPWAADELLEPTEIISEIMERRGWVGLGGSSDDTGATYKMRARRDGPQSAKRRLNL